MAERPLAQLMAGVGFRIHPSLVKTANPARLAEWRRVLDEYNDAADAVTTIEIALPPDDQVQLRVEQATGASVVRIAMKTLEPLLAEYGETIRHMVRIDREAPARGFEALDYAKRVVHDEGADVLRAQLRAVAPIAIDDARHLFTLVFLVASDLPEELVRYHRRH